MARRHRLFALLWLLAVPGASGAAPEAPEWVFTREVASSEGLSSGEVDDYLLEVSATQPLRVLMTLTDPAGPEPALRNNDLDLELEGPDGTFPGYALPEELGTEAVRPGPLPEEQVSLNPGALRDGTWIVHVRGVSVPDGPQGYRLQVSGALTEIGEAAAARLLQNDPNPVTSSTTIRFTLPARSDILLSVYDIAGRTVKTLVEGGREAGEHSAAWDGNDDAGEPARAGIYFYRLQGPGIDLTRKLIVIR